MADVKVESATQKNESMTAVGHPGRPPTLNRCRPPQKVRRGAHLDEADGQEDVDVDADAVDGERVADAADEAGDAAAEGAA